MDDTGGDLPTDGRQSFRLWKPLADKSAITLSNTSGECHAPGTNTMTGRDIFAIL